MPVKNTDFELLVASGVIVFVGLVSGSSPSSSPDAAGLSAGIP